MNQVYLKNVVSLKLDASKCNGCRMCTAVCPHEVFSIASSKKAEIINKDACMECGACARNCEQKAIEVKSGVGCACAVINGFLRNSEPSCDCDCG